MSQPKGVSTSASKPDQPQSDLTYVDCKQHCNISALFWLCHKMLVGEECQAATFYFLQQREKALNCLGNILVICFCATIVSDDLKAKPFGDDKLISAECK